MITKYFQSEPDKAYAHRGQSGTMVLKVCLYDNGNSRVVAWLPGMRAYWKVDTSGKELYGWWNNIMVKPITRRKYERILYRWKIRSKQ